MLKVKKEEVKKEVCKTCSGVGMVGETQCPDCKGTGEE